MKKTFIKINQWLDHSPFTLLVIMVICGVILFIGQLWNINKILLPILGFSLVAFRMTYAILLHSAQVECDQVKENEECLEEIESQNDYWWDVVGTVIERDSKSYEDSLKIIRDLRKKYTITVKK